MSWEIPQGIKTWSQFGHPILMWILLGITVYSLYSGIQIRRIRKVEPEVRKELIQKKFNLKHHQIGSFLLAMMVLGTIGGMAVTYINNGKLFFGPHLLVGLGMTGIIAVSTALVPFMQKGNNFARYTHIVLNVSLMGLFGWQAVSGMQIVQKIISKL